MEAQSASRILLEPPKGSWVAHRIVIGAVYLMAAYFIGLGLYDMLFEDIIIVYMFVLGFLVLILAEALRRAHLRDIAAGAITLADGKLTIESHQFLKSAIVVPLEDVRVAATAGTPLDAAVDTPGGGVQDQAFPVHNGSPGSRGDSVVDHLGARAPALPVPSLAREGSSINVVLLFRRLVPAPALQRRTAYGPNPHQPIGGLGLRVEDPLHARSVLEAFGLRSRITENDLEWYVQLEARRQRGDVDEVEASAGAPADLDLVALGWALFLVSVWRLPFLEVGAMFVAVLIWRQGRRVMALALGALSFYHFTYHLWKLSQPEPTPPGVYELGALVTVFFFITFGVLALMRRRTGGAQRGSEQRHAA